MKGSFHLATITRIPVKIHWSFSLLLLVVVYLSSNNGFNFLSFISILTLFLSIIFCVVLHEFGHAIVARIFGVQTFDIILTPIGGIARLERMPEGKGQEFWVAIAGPTVNFIIAAIIGLGFLVTLGDFWPNFPINSWTLNSPAREYFFILMTSNVGLGLFNLIPAFPMDGGRILRSLLSIWIDRIKATRIASYCGQVIALIMFGYALLDHQPILTLIGVFIFFAARQEYKALQRQTWLTKTKASDLMEPIEHALELGQTMSEAKERIKQLKGDSFIVWAGPQLPAGYLTREFISNFDPARYPGSLTDAWVIPSPAVVPPETPASQLLAFMQHHKIPLALVSEDHHYQGIVHWKKLSEGA